MENELAEYNEDRNRQISILLEKQRCELVEIDNEVTKLGITVADITETMQDVHVFAAAAAAAAHLSPHEKQMLSRNSHYNNNRASVISLQHSHSSSSFVSNATNANGTTTHK
ncbi:unnamed protein product [Rotaria magnacalcarata]|nr:unnamed protein product [Rotaria magnacalcarata]